MANKLFPDFCWFIDIKKKKKPLENALQIQYLVKKIEEKEGGKGVVQVQAINTFIGAKTADEQSGAPLYFKIEDFDLLKMVTMKQWLLALTWEGCMKKLPAKSASLLGGYILYYEKILDIVMGSGNVEILKKWLEIEFKSDGKQMELKAYSPEKDRDWHQWHREMENIWAVLDFWNLGMAYKMEDPRKMDKKRRNKVLLEVKKWLSGQRENLAGEFLLFESEY